MIINKHESQLVNVVNEDIKFWEELTKDKRTLRAFKHPNTNEYVLMLDGRVICSEAIEEVNKAMKCIIRYEMIKRGK